VINRIRRFQIQDSGRLYQKVAVDIAQRIHAGEFAVGERMPTERALAEILEVSRPTVREALIALEIEGLIEIRSGSGSYVRNAPEAEIDLETLFDVGHSPTEIIGTRLIIEPQMAAIAAEQATEEHIDEMRRALAAGWQDFETHAERSASFANDADGKFHGAIAAASGNNLNKTIVRHLWKGLRSPLNDTLERKVDLEQHAELPLLDHESILRAIEGRNPDGARNAMERHLKRYQKLLGI